MSENDQNILSDIYDTFERLSSAIDDAYAALENKQALIPENRRASNLSSAIESISVDLKRPYVNVLSGSSYRFNFEYELKDAEFVLDESFYRNYGLSNQQLCSNALCGVCSNNTRIMSSPILNIGKTVRRCCRQMFAGCGNLTAAGPISLDFYSKSTFGQECIWMFQYCTALSTAPELLTETLDGNMYYAMFAGCSSLTGDIYIHATSSYYATGMNHLLSGVSSDLTLHFKPAFESQLSTMTGYPTFDSGGTVNIVYDIGE